MATRSRSPLPASTPANSMSPTTQRDPTNRKLSQSMRLAGAPSRRQEEALIQSENDRTDALWAEMQATLAEVELSAGKGMHFFGEEHSKALEELRKAQVGLAKAWSRNDAEGEVVKPGAVDVKAEKAKEAAQRTRSMSTRTKDTGIDHDDDIALAKQRRDANDRYFARVSRGVLEVVNRLEGVAAAMNKVEKESQQLWSESESMTSTSNSIDEGDE